jgi:hypothetical protein
MTFRHAQQRPRGARRLTSSLFPFLQGARADAKQRRERRLTQAGAFADRLDVPGQLYPDTPALAALDGTPALKNLLPDVSLWS